MSDDKLIKAIQDFKNSLGQKGETKAIHGKDYATVEQKIEILRKNQGKNLKIRITF